MGKVRRLTLVMVALLALSALAAEEPIVLPEPAHGAFTGEQWRYRRATLFSDLLLRTAADLVAIPSGAPWWGPSEWVLFYGTVGSTVALSVGRPSLDVQFHGFVQNELLGGPGHLVMWGMAGDLIIWSITGAATVAVLLYGLITGHEASTETAALMIEAFAVAQIYHNLIKLLVGRAGPKRPDLEGQYFGPVEAVKFWPAGTPSGHMASMYALLSVIMYSVDHPAVWVGLNAFALVFGATLVGDNYHWLSDVTLGAAIGFCVGRWVVQHRSTHYVYGEAEPPSPIKVSLMPVVLPGTGAGLGVVGTF